MLAKCWNVDTKKLAGNPFKPKNTRNYVISKACFSTILNVSFQFSFTGPSLIGNTLKFMELPHRVGGSYSTPIHPFLAHSSPPPGPLPISTAAVPAVYASSSLSSSSQEVMTPHVDVVVCTCTDRPPNRSHHYEETSVHDASEATPMSGSIVNMEDTHASSIRPPSTPPPAYSHFHSDMSPNACFSPLPQASVVVADLPLQSASVANAHDPLIHSSYSLASSSVTVNQLQRVATGAGLCVSADLLTTSTTGPVCRICHLPYEESKPLLSPCRCSGTLQFVHNACLVVSCNRCDVRRFLLEKDPVYMY